MYNFISYSLVLGLLPTVQCFEHAALKHLEEPGDKASSMSVCQHVRVW